MAHARCAVQCRGALTRRTARLAAPPQGALRGAGAQPRCGSPAQHAACAGATDQGACRADSPPPRDAVRRPQREGAAARDEDDAQRLPGATPKAHAIAVKARFSLLEQLADECGWTLLGVLTRRTQARVSQLGQERDSLQSAQQRMAEDGTRMAIEISELKARTTPRPHLRRSRYFSATAAAAGGAGCRGRRGPRAVCVAASVPAPQRAVGDAYSPAAAVSGVRLPRASDLAAHGLAARAPGAAPRRARRRARRRRQRRQRRERSLRCL